MPPPISTKVEQSTSTAQSGQAASDLTASIRSTSNTEQAPKTLAIALVLGARDENREKMDLAQIMMGSLSGLASSGKNQGTDPQTLLRHVCKVKSPEVSKKGQDIPLPSHSPAHSFLPATSASERANKISIVDQNAKLAKSAAGQARKLSDEWSQAKQKQLSSAHQSIKSNASPAPIPPPLVANPINAPVQSHPIISQPRPLHQPTQSRSRPAPLVYPNDLNGPSSHNSQPSFFPNDTNHTPHPLSVPLRFSRPQVTGLSSHQIPARSGQQAQGGAIQSRIQSRHDIQPDPFQPPFGARVTRYSALSHCTHKPVRHDMPPSPLIFMPSQGPHTPASRTDVPPHDPILQQRQYPAPLKTLGHSRLGRSEPSLLRTQPLSHSDHNLHPASSHSPRFTSNTVHYDPASLPPPPLQTENGRSRRRFLFASQAQHQT